MNKILNGLILSGMLLGGVSCSSDYLDVPPVEQVPQENLSQSLETFEAALNGMCQTMYILWDSDATERFGNGEGYIQTFYGDSPSPDFANTFLWGSQTQNQAWAYMQRDDRAGDSYGWIYSYSLINQANQLLAQVDNVVASDSQKDFMKAQVLTMRAHAYIRLMQIYGPRYEDSQNGKKLCVVLRLEPGTDPMPLSDYETVMKQIYSDLDTAIELYKSSNGKRDAGFQPNLNVAQGLYSRIALINHDWEKAKTMAHDGRQGFPIMSAEDYKAGFADANGEWLWYNNFDSSNNGYYSWGATFTCNGGYGAAYNFGGAGGQMAYDLYKQIYDKNNTDIRCELFWMPDKANKYHDYGFTEADFWNSDIVGNAFLNMWLVDPAMTEAISLWVKYNTPNGFDGGFDIYTDFYSAEDAGNEEYYKEAYAVLKENGFEDRVQFGAQIKFWSYSAELGDAQHPFMRAAELLLNEAEAALELNDEATAINCLKELNSQRMDGYECNLTGDALKEELRLYRRMELWGEGDTWFSMKRWNVTAERKSWVEGDPTSGNFLTTYKGTYAPNYANGWVYQIPRIETDYNPLINSQLNQK